MADYKYKPNAKKQAYDYNYELEHYDRIVVKASKGTKDKVKQAAESSGLSMNVWLCELIDKELSK